MSDVYFEFIQHIPLAILNIIISLFVLRIAYVRQSDIRGGNIFIAVNATLIIRALIIIPTFANDDLNNLLFWQNLQWSLNAIIVTLWLLFTLAYTQSLRISRAHIAMGSIVPIMIAILVAFDEQLGLIRTSYEIVVQQDLPMLRSELGILYMPITAYMYGIAIVGVIILLRYILASPGTYRRQMLGILISLALLITVYLIQSEVSIHPALAPQVIILIAQFIIILGILRNGFLQFHPTSRPLLMLAMVDGFILFDHYNRVTDLNDPMSAILARHKSRIIGESITTVFATMPSILAIIDGEDTDNAIDFDHRVQDKTTYYQVSIFRIQDRGHVSRCMVWRDVTAQKIAEQERLENLANQARIQALTQFVQTASHDLKHPLTNIGVKLYLLDKTLTDEKQHAHIQAIQAQTDKLQKIMDDMFLLMRLESQPSLSLAHTPFFEVLDAIQSRYAEVYGQKGVSLDFIKDGTVSIYGDSDLIFNALAQLMNNALQYTAEGGRVSVTVETDTDFTLVKVTDNGAGIPDAIIHHLADPFFRADPARNSTSGGVGLGLTLVHRIMTLHNGSLHIESHVNQGTSVILRFPQDPSSKTPNPVQHMTTS